LRLGGHHFHQTLPNRKTSRNQLCPFRKRAMMALKDHIARTGLNQSEAAKLLGVTQPRISDLMRGKIELFGLDTLVNMIGAAGLHVEMRISDAA
jgi:predicted XRE-type DNA-binding protein